MKKIFRLSCIALAIACCFSACVKEVPQVPSVQKEELRIDYSAPAFEAGFYVNPEDGTKTYLEGSKNLCWTADDRLSVFTSTTDNRQYVFCGNTGDRQGPVRMVASDQEMTGEGLDCSYAVYPYNSTNSISGEGVLTVTMPETQNYRKNSFDNGSNTMVAVCDDSSNNFSFRNSGGYLVLKMYGKVTVKNVTITANSGEKLSGKADISISGTNAPALRMHDDASSSVTLDCGSGVALAEKEADATEFWFVLPPVSFSKGFTVSVTASDGKTFCKSKITSGTLSRNKVVTTAPFNVTTTAGEFVGLLAEEVKYDLDAIKALAKEELGDISEYEGLITAASLIGIIKTVVMNKIIYTTTDVRGNIIEASGIVAYDKDVTKTGLFQKNNKYSKLLSVQHVTYDIVGEAPTSQKVPYEMAGVFKSGVDVAVIADYLGYGVSQTADLQHPYMHSASTGRDCANLIEAAQSFLSSKKGINADSNMKIDLVGYSQGAAATISTLVELENRGRSIGNITVGGCPADLLCFMNKFIDNPDVSYSRLGFLAYVARGLDYGDNLNLDFHNIFAPKVFSSGAFAKFSTLGVGYWHGLIGKNIMNLLHEDFFAADNDYNSNADVKKIIKSLQDNSVVNLSPSKRKNIVLYHSPSDDTVPYECSTAAKAKWGCTLKDLEKASHDDAGIEFYVKYVGGDTIWKLAKDYF